jgi:hypothetical protein
MEVSKPLRFDSEKLWTFSHITCYFLYAKDTATGEDGKQTGFSNTQDLMSKRYFHQSESYLVSRLLFYSSVHSRIGSISSKKGDETMHREPLNQEIVNAFNFMIIPIVMAIVFFLVVHPYSSAS